MTTAMKTYQNEIEITMNNGQVITIRDYTRARPATGHQSLKIVRTDSAMNQHMWTIHHDEQLVIEEE